MGKENRRTLAPNTTGVNQHSRNYAAKSGGQKKTQIGNKKQETKKQKKLAPKKHQTQSF